MTIATNMAGRGTDIILGGNPEFMAWADLKRATDEDGRPLYPTRLEVPKDVWEAAVAKYEPEMRVEGREVAGLGGLHIIGTERHESRRIDNQLRGRSGRQGDPGSSRFFLSLEDDLMRKFAGEWVSAVLTRFGMEEGEAIEQQDGLAADRGSAEEGRGAQLRRAEEPARIRRGHGRAAEADLFVPPAAARRHTRPRTRSWR